LLEVSCYAFEIPRVFNTGLPSTEWLDTGLTEELNVLAHESTRQVHGGSFWRVLSSWNTIPGH